MNNKLPVSVKNKFISICLLLSLAVTLLGHSVPQSSSQQQLVDLNGLLLNKFDEYNAWLVRRLSINGTTSDPFDYSRVPSGGTTNMTLSFPGYLLALTYLYEGTSNGFYLRQLQSFIDGALANNLFYVDVAGVGQIFSPPSWYWGNEDQDTASIYPGIFGYISTKLYLWTGDLKYRAIADRIASESYDKLAVVKNATDVAWSWAYYLNRDETNAKIGVNRQTFMAWFYALYGNNVNSTFTPFVGRIINWVWRSELADNSLAYNIGETSTNPYYTAFSVTAALNAYLVNSSSFQTALKNKIKGTVTWLNTRSDAQYDYQHLYFLVPALLTALKTDYFAPSVSTNRAKSMLYVALNSMHLTNKGLVTRLSDYSFGFRWQQLTVGTLFAVYPLTDYLLDMDQFNPVTTYESEIGQYELNGWAGEIFATTLRDGRDYYGSQIAHPAGRSLHFNPAGYQPLPTAVWITNDTYYVRVRSAYSSYTVDYFAYPVGVFVGDVKGTTTPSIVLDNSPLWRIRVANGSEWQLTALTSGHIYSFGTKMLLYFNDTNPANRRSFFVKNNKTADWEFSFVYSAPRLNFSTLQTDYRIIYGEVGSFGHLIQNADTMYKVAESLVDAHDTLQPVSFDQSFHAYHNKITELEPEATWKTFYQSAQMSPVKLVGHNLPEQVSVTAWSFSNKTLSCEISASAGTESIVEIYVGTMGEPSSVYSSNGVVSWNHNVSSQILELRTIHIGPAKITVDWRIPGDVNGDGTIDSLDLALLQEAYGSEPSSLNWNQNCDFNRDGIIDASDLSLLARNFGRHY